MQQDVDKKVAELIVGPDSERCCSHWYGERKCQTQSTKLDTKSDLKDLGVQPQEECMLTHSFISQKPKNHRTKKHQPVIVRLTASVPEPRKYTTTG